MKIVLALLTFFVGVNAASAATPAKPPITREAVRQAIAVFREQPTSSQGQAAGSLIVHYAQESREVEVVIAGRALPWYRTRPSPKHSGVLLAAYLAGSIRSQLEHGVVRDDPLAGAVQVIETYRLLRKTEPNYHVPEIDALVSLKARGKLKGYIQSQHRR